MRIRLPSRHAVDDRPRSSCRPHRFAPRQRRRKADARTPRQRRCSRAIARSSSRSARASSPTTGAGSTARAVARWAAEIAAVDARGQGDRARIVGRDRRGECSGSAGRRGPRRSTICRPPRRSARWGSCRRTKSAFAKYGLHTAQMLLTHEDLVRPPTLPQRAHDAAHAARAARRSRSINENDTVDDRRDPASATTTRSARS